MPAKSKAFANLAGAALGGADFPKAANLRASMTTEQLRDFASTPRRFLPAHATAPRVSASVRVPSIRKPSLSRASHPLGNLGKYAHARRKF